MALRSCLIGVCTTLTLLHPLGVEASEPESDVGQSSARAILDLYTSALGGFDVAGIDALLHPDFEFVPMPVDGIDEGGWDRATEMKLLGNQFQGGEGGMPQFVRWEQNYTIVSELESPDFAGGLEVACDVEVRWERVDGRKGNGRSRQVVVLLPARPGEGEYLIRRITEVGVLP